MERVNEYILELGPLTTWEELTVNRALLGSVSFLEVEDSAILRCLHRCLDLLKSWWSYCSPEVNVGVTIAVVLNFGLTLESPGKILKMLMAKLHLDQLNKNH